MKLNIAAAGIILKDKKILLLKRAKNSKLFADYWGSVGGKIANEEESLVDTASEK